MRSDAAFRTAMAFAAVAALLGGVFLYLQVRQLQEDLRLMQTRMVLMMRQTHAGSGGGKEDPYISGAVKNTILRHYTEIGSIYKRYLSLHPRRKSGKVRVDWQIAPDGRVIDPGIVISELDAGSRLETGLLAAIAAWHFPPPPSGMRRYVAHTFVFRDHPMTDAEKADARRSVVENVVRHRKAVKQAGM